MQRKRIRKCAVKECRQTFEPRSMTHKACSPACAEIIAKQDREKRERKEVRQRKEKLKTRSDYIKEAQIAFNTYIRTRDANLPCISCGCAFPDMAVGGLFDCGHYRSVGSAPHLRFDVRNAHAQCKKCNRYLGGRAVDYRIGLISRIGLQALEALEADQTVAKWDIPELIAIRNEFRLKTKELHKQRSEES